ncbi:hypothetical protein CF150_27639 [Pseudomonas sp. CF150]|nr:hypothetical protein CF150_27639 [Pseudomonas sp. CF150]
MAVGYGVTYTVSHYRDLPIIIATRSLGARIWMIYDPKSLIFD